MPRYIDAEELKKWLKRWKGYLDDDMIQRMQICVKDIPTIEERKKGKWIYHKGLSESRECSCCHVWFDWDMPRNSFCPNCGADMREEKTDDRMA